MNWTVNFERAGRHPGRMSAFFRILVIALIAGLVAFRTDGAMAADVQPSNVIAPPATFDPGGYVLGPGDKLHITVFGETGLTGDFAVAANGNLSLPLIGDVRATGLTVKAVQEEITNALANGYIKDPRVSAEVENARPFFILGEVNKPGQYPYTDHLTVLNAVATAGGFTYRASTDDVYIKKENQTVEQEYPLTTATPVAPGDTIRIGERYF